MPWLGPFHGAIAVPSVTRCRCCRCCCGHRCAGGVRQWRRATVVTPGEWQRKTGGVRRLAVANGPNIFQMLLVSHAITICTLITGYTRAAMGVTSPTVNVTLTTIYSSSQHASTTGTHVSYGITVHHSSFICHPAEVKILPVPQPIKAGTRFSDHRHLRGMQLQS